MKRGEETRWLCQDLYDIFLASSCLLSGWGSQEMNWTCARFSSLGSRFDANKIWDSSAKYANGFIRVNRPKDWVQFVQIKNNRAQKREKSEEFQWVEASIRSRVEVNYISQALSSSLVSRSRLKSQEVWMEDSIWSIARSAEFRREDEKEAERVACSSI